MKSISKNYRILNLSIIQFVAFIIINIFWMINRNTFFRSIDTINAVYINGFINIFISIAGVAIISYSSIVLSKIKFDILLGFNMLIVYNLLPLLIQQKSMFGILILLTIVFTVYLSCQVVKIITNKYELESKTGRIIIGLIIALFALVFISRGFALLIKSINTINITNEISVGISDILICSFWAFVGFSFVINKSIGNRFIYSVYINGTLLFLTLASSNLKCEKVR